MTIGKYTLKGGKKITLTQRDFVAKGGEKTVYHHGDEGYAIYENNSQMPPLAKIAELQILTHPNIIKPEQLIIKGRGNQVVGHTMRFIQDSIALCQLFTKAFRQRNNLDNDDMVVLVKKFQALIAFIHSKNVLVIDLNEFNFLASSTLDDIYAIDTNSYQTASFPATVIMPSVRDPHCNNLFTQETDWYSWGIVAFQMLIGVHPYKGKHPQFSHLKLDERMAARMQANVSIFDVDASVPKVCQSLDVIPSALRAWFEAVFQNGNRVAPPFDFEAVIAQVSSKIQEISGTDLFDIKEVAVFTAPLIRHLAIEGARIAITEEFIVVNGKEYKLPQRDVKIALTPKMGHAIAAWLEGGKVYLRDIQKNYDIPFTSAGNALMEYGGRLYIQNNQAMLEIIFSDMGSQILASVKQVGRVMDMPDATKVFDGIVIQNMLGRYVASLFPESGQCYQPQLAELDGYKLIEAKYENHVLVVIGVVSGTKQYDRFVIRFSDDFKTHDCRKVENITYTGINFTVATQGIVVLINEDETLEAFSRQKEAHSVKHFDEDGDNKLIASDMRLSHEGTAILFCKGRNLYRLSMKN
ncbi:MAG: hypothetical protein GQ569_06600 [Methylococcaceae bacterium]|nr:hypothetical protein [Methylococcaceae bacterium]